MEEGGETVFPAATDGLRPGEPGALLLFELLSCTRPHTMRRPIAVRPKWTGCEAAKGCVLHCRTGIRGGFSPVWTLGGALLFWSLSLDGNMVSRSAID